MVAGLQLNVLDDVFTVRLSVVDWIWPLSVAVRVELCAVLMVPVVAEKVALL